MIGGDRRKSNGAIDWAEVRSRLAALHREGDEHPGLSDAESRALLEERARALAIPATRDRSEATLELVRFHLADERYAVESRFVFEAFLASDIALLPGADAPVVGLTAWRGELLTLLDLRPMMRLAPSAGAHPKQVLVLGQKDPAFGVLVDRVGEILEIPAASVRALTGGRGDFVQGTTDDALLIIAAPALIQNFS